MAKRTVGRGVVRPGAPLRVDDVVDRDASGAPLRAVDVVTKWLAAGLPDSTALAHAGLPVSTFHGWLRAAAKIRQRLAAYPDASVSDDDLALLEFSASVDKAVADAESRFAIILARVAEGGLPQRKERTKYDSSGNVVERTVDEWSTLPDARALIFLLVNRFGWTQDAAPSTPARPPEELPLEEQADVVLDAFEEMLANAAAKR